MSRIAVVFGLLALCCTVASAHAADFAVGGAAHRQGNNGDALAKIRTLAEKGDPNAQYRLCEMRVHGRGADQDFAEAVRWCEKAAKAGVAEAQATLAGLQMLGLGTQRNYQDAYYWTIISAIWGKDTLRGAAMRALSDVSRILRAREKVDIARDAVNAWRR